MPLFLLDSKIDYFGTARTRLGYAPGPWLFYGTGGLAWAHNRFREVAPAIRFDADQFYVGWTVGGGVEYAFAPRWSVKAEYLYANFHENRDAFEAFPRTIDPTTSAVRVGLNYRLGGVDSGGILYPVKAPALTTAWSGSYIGLQGGYAWGHEPVIDGVFGQASSLNPSGGFGGSQTGYNWLIAPRCVFGLESETSFGSLTDSRLSSGGVAVTTKLDLFGSERARLGFLLNDSVLLYGTGGLAWTHVKYDIDTVIASFNPFDAYRVGWTAGAGVEYAFDPLWSAKLEYLHADFDEYSNPYLESARTFNLTTDSVRMGVNYHGDLLKTLFGI